MNIEGMFPSKYVKASDLQGRQVTVKIDRVGLETVGDETKAVVFFQGMEKPMVLNVTNKNAITDMYGYETNDWTGQPVVLYEVMVQYQSKMVPAIRIKAPVKQIQRAAPPRNQPARQTNAAPDDPRSDDDMDDIKF